MPNPTILTSTYTKNGICRLFEMTDRCIYQDCELNNLTINKCSNLNFANSLVVAGTSERPKQFDPLVKIWNSTDVKIKHVHLTGTAVSSERVFLSKGATQEEKRNLIGDWNLSTPSGINISNSSQNITIGSIQGHKLQIGLMVQKAKNVQVSNQYFNTFGAWAFFINDASYVHIGSHIAENAIKTLPYNKTELDDPSIVADKYPNAIQIVHRDFGLLSASTVDKPDDTNLHNIQIDHSFYRDGDYALSQSPDGLLIHTDGVLKDSTITNVDAISDTQEHGISSVDSLNCHFSAVKLERRHPKDGKNSPFIILKKRKDNEKLEISANNNIIAWNTITVDVPDGQQNTVKKVDIWP